MNGEVKMGLKEISIDSIRTTAASMSFKQDNSDTPPQPVKVVDLDNFETLIDRVAEVSVRMGIIPEAFKDDVFHRDRVMDSYQKLKENGRSFNMVNLDQVLSTMEYIIQRIHTRKGLEHSYLIGSPNGFGKTSFVMTCLKLMVHNGMKTVPYISLSELAQMKNQVDNALFRGQVLKRKSDKPLNIEDRPEITSDKQPLDCISRFSWNEYLNADILFTFFTNVEYKVIESRMLKVILDIRASKGLPTVVCISSSVKTYFQPYLSNRELTEWYWDEIYTQDESLARFDRVWHISTYKTYVSQFN